MQAIDFPSHVMKNLVDMILYFFRTGSLSVGSPIFRIPNPCVGLCYVYTVLQGFAETMKQQKSNDTLYPTVLPDYLN